MKVTDGIVDQNENDSDDENSNIYASNNDWGYSKIYKIKERDDGKYTPVLVFVSENYEYRGESLAFMNRMEYYCLTHIDKATNDESNDNNDENSVIKCGKKKSKQFRLGKGHKLEGAYCQKLLSKQKIGIHAGYFPRIPYPFDGNSEEEKKNLARES